MDNQEQIYAQAEALAEKATTAAQVKEAVELFRSIAGYRDAGPRSVALNTRYDLLLEQEQAAQAREEEAAAKRKKLKSIIIAIACAVGVVALFALLIHSGKLADYRDAEDLLARGQYEAAYNAFTRLGGFKDSEARAQQAEGLRIQAEKQAKYDRAMELIESSNTYDWSNAYNILKELGDFSDAQQKVSKFRLLAVKEEFETSNEKYYNYKNEFSYNKMGLLSTHRIRYSRPGYSGYTQAARYIYDDQGLLQEISYDYPGVMTSQYPDDTLVTDKYIYDSDDRLIDKQVIAHDGTVNHEYQRWYDQAGNLLSTSVTDEYIRTRADGKTLAYCVMNYVDDQDRVVKTWVEEIDANGNFTGKKYDLAENSYNADGQLAQKTQYANAEKADGTRESVVTTYTYEDGKLMQEKRSDGATTTYTYDNVGGLLERKTDTATTEYTNVWVYAPEAKED